MQRKMANELAKLERELAQAKAEESRRARESQPVKKPILSNNDRAYMSQKALARYNRKMKL